MKNRMMLVSGVLVGLLLLLYMVTFQLRFDQVAVVTTFDKAGADSVKRTPALYCKWPYPIQEVRLYDTRVQILEAPLEQHTTRDSQSVVVGAYVAWRVQDPLAVFRSFKGLPEIEALLRDHLRDAKSLLGTYSFDQLTSADPARFKLPELEQAIRDKLAREMKERNYGLAIEAVGITRLMLPEQVTPKVFEHMRRTRERLAQSARSEGTATADAIRSTAERDQKTILAFAERQAEAIKAEAYKNVAPYFKEFEANDAFAIFLNQLKALEETLQHNTTFLLDTQTAPFDLLGKPKDEGPGAKKGP